MTTTTRLALPLIDAVQAQKHVTHNEALALLDVVAQARVLDRDLAAPPATPSEGDAYLVAAAPTGGWTGHAGSLAVWQTGAWMFIDAGEGWRIWVVDEARLLVRAGGAWVDLVAAGMPDALQNLSRIGLGTTADAANPLSVRLNTALLAALPVADSGTGDLRLALNKEASGNTVSLVLQSGWSGRAEIGLAGSDDLAVKVSADGTTWRTGFSVAAGSGVVSAMGLVPAADNTYTLGASGARWSQIHAASATIVTSDAAAKTDVAADVPGLDLVRRLRPVTYRLAAADGGRPGRRRHCGLIAQEVKAALDGRDLALWTRDSAGEGLRYEELVPVLTRALQQIDDRLARIEALSGASPSPEP